MLNARRKYVSLARHLYVRKIRRFNSKHLHLAGGLVGVPTVILAIRFAVNERQGLCNSDVVVGGNDGGGSGGSVASRRSKGTGEAP